MTPALLGRAAAVYDAARESMATPAEAMRDAVAYLRSVGGYQPQKLRAPGVPPDIEAVIEGIARFHGYSLEDLRRNDGGRYDAHRLTRVRGEAAYVARVLSDVSYPELGQYFGGRHHSTVLSAREKFAARLAEDDVLRARIERIVGAKQEEARAA